MAIKFSTEEVSKFIDSNCFETRQKWKEFSKDELFIPRFNQSLREQKDFALKRLEVIAKNKVFSVYDFINNPLNVFANHEMASYIDASMATKLTVQLNLFGGTVATLGTQRHKHIADGVDTLSTIGCFCLTELGFGNNAVQMETTAEYDPESKEFIIHSPTVLSQKYWITNGAYHCNYAVVFAQLIMPGNKKEGVHSFLVRIRNEDKSVRDGIFIEDMGAKFGNNGVDNGRLKFDNVRIPRENMLNQFSDVLEDGTFVSKIQNKRERFLKVADRLLSGRLCIASMMITSSKFALLVAVRFANKRMAMGPTGLSDTPISDFGLFQNQVYPLLARTFTLNIAFNHAKDLYSASLLQKKEASAFLVCLCCAMKPLISWNARDVGTTLVERIGGQGYLSCNRVHELLSGAHSGITAEGDNSVLFQKVSKEIMIMVQKNQYEFAKPSTTKESLNISKDFCIESMMDLLIHKELFLIDKMANVTMQKMGEGKSQYEIWMREDNDLVQDLARSFGERIVAQFCLLQLKKASQNIRELFTLYFQLHLNSAICRELGWYIVNNFVSVEGAKRLQENLKQSVFKIHPYALLTLNSLGIPEHLLSAPIAQDYVAYNDGPNEGELYRPRL